MNDSALLKTFGSHDFLKNLHAHHLMRLAAGVRPFTAAAGSYLAREGGSAGTFYLIQSGRVDILSPGENGVPMIVDRAGPGEVVGWSWLLPPHRWHFDCRAVEDVQGLAFDAEWLRDLCENDHELGYHLTKHLLAVVSRRLANARKAVLLKKVEAVLN